MWCKNEPSSRSYIILHKNKRLMSVKEALFILTSPNVVVRPIGGKESDWSPPSARNVLTALSKHEYAKISHPDVIGEPERFEV